MKIRSLLIPLLAVAAQTTFAQWEVAKIAGGGETTVASDGAGNVYVTGHIPCALYKSSDWAHTFATVKSFPDGLGDTDVITGPNGQVDVAYMDMRVDGTQVWYSTDHAATLAKGVGPNGPLDREWMVADPATGKVYMDFSNGYIGGPKSKGVFLVTSTDNCKTFSQPVRVDREPEGSYAVDPYIARSAGGRIYCMWQVSTDYNTIDAFRFAFSDDEGKTFSVPQTLATIPKTLGKEKVDTQERWVLGSIAAVGEKGVIMTYPGYEEVTVDGKPAKAYLQHYRVSTDGGQTFSGGKTFLSKQEIVAAIRNFQTHGGAKVQYPYYIENLPWLATDPRGRVHAIFTDNRDGEATVKGKDLANWRVRHCELTALTGTFGKSEAVSEDYAARRPPMDFNCCAADSKYLYVTWTETPSSDADYPSFQIFTGDLYVGRKPLK